ncbi:MAG: hypothetical protein GXY58_11535 [Planctomycetaceae bacterium]|nr:hypothetical protein [Planctomycetaceae bacterium]
MSQSLDRRMFLGLAIVAVAGGIAGFHARASAADAADQPSTLLVGAAKTSITPDRPVALQGQMHTRISTAVESPVTAVALALESRRGAQVVDQALFVSCDLTSFRGGLIEKVRERIRDRLPDFDAGKLILTATHTHCAPVLVEGAYNIPPDGVMQPTEYFEFLVGRLSDVIVEAWQSRAPGSVGWGLGHAVVAQQRRAVYADGHAEMYGKTDRPDFRSMEGYEDHGVEVLLVWDRAQNLVATAINVACPAQEVESRLTINADYWHEVRQLLAARHGEQLAVLGWIGAAGDQSPHLQFRQAAEDRMRELRGLTRLEEIARRIGRAWEEAYQGASQDRRTDVVLAHHVETVELPLRVVTAEEVAAAREQVAKLSKDPAQHTLMRWHQRVIDRWEQQLAAPDATHPMELHVVRLGDVAIATNNFELYTDFGVAIKARSPALQTFILQLAGESSYLPSARAVEGGGYGAVPQSNRVGPEGGQVLVDRTVELIKSLWQ